VSIGTPFHSRLAPLNRQLQWADWSGYLSSLCYADFHDIEYSAVRNAVGVFDVSPLYKYIVSGPDAERLVDRIVTRDATKLAVGQVLYTPWCDERGKVVDDGTITRIAESEYRWTAAHPVWRWITMNAGGLDASVKDVSDATGALAMQGPLSREALAAATGEDWADVRYFRSRPTEIGGVPVDVTRTGYTGDLGYELWVPADGAEAVWDRLAEAGSAYGLRPAGLRALDVVRLEAGLILVDVDYVSVLHAETADHEYSPFEIGLDRLVDFGKRDFVGRRALAAEQAAGGPPRRLAALVLNWDDVQARFDRHGLPPAISAVVQRDPVPVFARRSQVGRTTSLGWSPMLKQLLALASVDPDHAEPGKTLNVEWSVEGERSTVGATVVAPPFLSLERRRT
jgi:aminomethyltransferase